MNTAVDDVLELASSNANAHCTGLFHEKEDNNNKKQIRDKRDTPIISEQLI